MSGIFKTTTIITSLIFSLNAVISSVSAETISEDTPLEELSSMSLEELLGKVITSTLKEQNLQDAPSSIEVITAEEIRQRGYKTIKEIMNDVPGFNDVSDTNEEIVAIRGVYASSTNKILTMINGHRMNDLQLGRYNVDQFIGMDIVERVEFIKGPGSALYGSGALIGVVNIITKEGKDINGTALRTQVGMYGTLASGTWGKKSDNIDILANFTAYHAQGQTLKQDSSLDVAPEGKEKMAGNIYLGRYPANWGAMVSMKNENMSLNVRGAQFERVTPRGSNSSFYDLNTEPLTPSYKENDFFVDYKNTFNIGSEVSKLTINPSFHTFNYFEKSFVGFGANDMPPFGTRGGNLSEMHNYQLKVIYENQLLDNVNFIAGFDSIVANYLWSNTLSIENAQKITLTPGYTKDGTWFTGGLLAQVIWSPIETLTLTTGGRYDTFGGEAPAKFTPRLGVVYRPFESLTGKLLYGSSYLAPMWQHTSSKDPNFKGNPDLQPESFDGLDLILMYKNENRFFASVNAFYNKVDGLINAIKDDPEKPVFSYKNSDNLLYTGFDFTSRYNITDWLQLRGSYSLVVPDITNTRPSFLIDNQIKDIPAHTIRYGITAEPMENLYLTLWGRTYSETRVKDPVTNNTTLPWIPLLDFSAGYSVGDTYNPVIENLIQQIDIQLFIRNLTNNQYELGGTIERPLARQGINFEGSIALKF